MAMRTMVGIAARSLAQLEGGQVSIAQFRLLAVLDERGPLPSSKAAGALGLGASSVTRLADRLETTGYLTRTRGTENRSVVSLALTSEGTALVERVVAWRRAELARLLDQLDPAEVCSAAATLRRLTRLVEEETTPGVPVAHLSA
jgi:DNA-binding MarR family transcriptional regulator